MLAAPRPAGASQVMSFIIRAGLRGRSGAEAGAAARGGPPRPCVSSLALGGAVCRGMWLPLYLSRAASLGLTAQSLHRTRLCVLSGTGGRTQHPRCVLGTFCRRSESCADHPSSKRVVQRGGRDLRTESVVNRAGLVSPRTPTVRWRPSYLKWQIGTRNTRRCSVLSQTQSALTGTKSGQRSCCWF